uniref:Uncharacterized protein n=1 Tax=Anguilla anguilla TaxID=7936 RepID=A0A0E9RY46_ANGAN
MLHSLNLKSVCSKLLKGNEASYSHIMFHKNYYNSPYAKAMALILLSLAQSILVQHDE